MKLREGESKTDLLRVLREVVRNIISEVVEQSGKGYCGREVERIVHTGKAFFKKRDRVNLLCTTLRARQSQLRNGYQTTQQYSRMFLIKELEIVKKGWLEVKSKEEPRIKPDILKVRLMM